jgi:hypothetical protein
MRSLLPWFSVAFALSIVACSPPKLSTPLTDIPKLASLEQVMDNQATVADPQWKKIGQTTYTDAEYAAFAEAAERIQVTSLKAKDFSKGPDFDALAMRLNEKAKALGAAASAKDAAASSSALSEMKATCKECHSKFK